MRRNDLKKILYYSIKFDEILSHLMVVHAFTIGFLHQRTKFTLLNQHFIHRSSRFGFSIKNGFSNNNTIGPKFLQTFFFLFRPREYTHIFAVIPKQFEYLISFFKQVGKCIQIHFIASIITIFKEASQLLNTLKSVIF